MRISVDHRVTLPIAVLDEAGLRPGDRVAVEAVGHGELRIRRAVAFESAFGALTGVYPERYLELLDADELPLIS